MPMNDYQKAKIFVEVGFYDFRILRFYHSRNVVF